MSKPGRIEALGRASAWAGVGILFAFLVLGMLVLLLDFIWRVAHG